MPYFADLTPYAYSGTDSGTLNIGWLDADHPYPTGEPRPEFASQLIRLVVDHAVRRTRGWQVCPFCGRHPATVPHARGEVPVGDAEIRVRHPDGRVFAAPTLVAHYVADHGYLPPAPFVEAVAAEAQTSQTS